MNNRVNMSCYRPKRHAGRTLIVLTLAIVGAVHDYPGTWLGSSVYVSAQPVPMQAPLQAPPLLPPPPSSSSSSLFTMSAMDQIVRASKLVLFANTHSPGLAVGTVIASPSRKDPDYYYHWVRDASISFMAVLDMLLDTSRDPTEPHSELEALLDGYALLSMTHQTSAARSGLGEPKFNVDGSPFMGEWGRPQNDGPALRALLLSEYALFILTYRPNRIDFVRTVLYDSQLPTYSVIKRDLEYISKEWHSPSFDLWEESLGTHFFTEMTQHAALVAGARLATLLDDQPAANWYLVQAQAIESALHLHWCPTKKYIQATLNWQGGLASKTSQLDIAVIIASLISVTRNSTLAPIFPPWDDQILLTSLRFVDSMIPLYKLNANTSPPVVGRYPEDVYDGIGFTGGNPWPLATCALAEHIYQVLAHWCHARSIQITDATLEFLTRSGVNTTIIPIAPKGSVIWTDVSFGPIVLSLVKYGDAIMSRVRQPNGHMNVHGKFELSEQWDSNTGDRKGAPLLTWSAVAVLRASRSRKDVVRNCYPFVKE
ncbi:hypothetical protein BASA62_009361 [Batrachochytrium salamandrivorans]|nr:hypothetical protein BASA62_009361 [Batrachochytrium salamandrivorans]